MLWAALMLAGGMLPVTSASAASVAGAPVHPPNTWSPTAGPMSVPRTSGTATLLADGDILVAGGGTRTADLYDPSTGTFLPTGSMSVAAREDATATLLANGRVLVAGGC